MKTPLPAVFLVRDGILNERVFDETRQRFVPPQRAEHLSLCRRAGSFLRGLNNLGYRCLVIASEDAGIGPLTPIRRDRINRRLRMDLDEQGASVHGIYPCPYDRKVSTKVLAMSGVILEAAATHHIEMHRSFLVANDLEDVVAGHSAGLNTIWVADSTERAEEEFTKAPDGRPSSLVDGLDEALALIRQDSRSTSIRPV